MGENHKKRREHMATFLLCVLFFSFSIYFVKRGIHWHGEGAQKMGKGDQPNSDTKSIFQIQDSVQKSSTLTYRPEMCVVVLLSRLASCFGRYR